MTSISSSTSQSYPKSYVQDLQEGQEAELRNYRSRAEADETRHEQRMEEQHRSDREELENTVGELKSHYEESATLEKENHRSELKRLKESLYDRSGRSSLDEATARKRTQEQVDRIQSDAQTRVEKAEAQAKNQIHRSLLNSQEREKTDSMTLRDAHERETSALREQMGISATLERKYQTDRANGAQKGYREVEQEFDRQKEQLETQFRSELEGWKSKYQRKSDIETEKNSEKLREQSERQAELLRRREEEHHSDVKMLSDLFERETTSERNQARQKQSQIESKLDEQHDKLNQDFEKAARAQSSTYNAQLKKTQHENRAETQALELKIQELKTTEDPFELSPAAQERIREAALSESRANLAERESQNQETLRALRDKANTDLLGLHDQYQQALSKLQREKNSLQTESRTEMLRLSQETEEQVASKLIQKDTALDKTLQTTTRFHSRELDALRRKYEEALETVKNDATAKNHELQLQKEFEARMVHRSFTTQQNELIREYEKRLTEQREDAANQADIIKESSQKLTRELEHKHRQEMEKADNFHEQQLTQLEQRFRERERIFAKNYQDEVEKLKRSNALLLAKKS